MQIKTFHSNFKNTRKHNEYHIILALKYIGSYFSICKIILYSAVSMKS